jgi:hypothetical protein
VSGAASISLPPDGGHRHLLIGGTGRAGTSFLVRYLAGLGLDTHLGRRGEADWDEAANAGLEDTLLPGMAADALPYVVKSAWLHEWIDDALAQGSAFRVDAVIVPVRPLHEAAASRVVLEMRAIHEKAPWMAERERSWDQWGGAAGGGVFSLHPLDQARVLAVGFHHLLERVVRADVPLVLLDFPRLVLDADYLFERIAPVVSLPPGMDLAQARNVHRRVADASKVRIDSELGAPGAGPQAPGLEALDQVAIRRELVRVRGEVQSRDAGLAGAAAERARMQAELDRLAAENEALCREITDIRARETVLRHEANAQQQMPLWRRMIGRLHRHAPPD